MNLDKWNEYLNLGYSKDNLEQIVYGEEDSLYEKELDSVYAKLNELEEEITEYFTKLGDVQIQEGNAERYFIVFFNGSNTIGSCTISTNGYVKRSTIHDYILKHYGHNKTTYAITNVVELSKNDFENYKK